MQITDEMLYQHASQARDLWLDTLPQRDEIPDFPCSKQFQRKMDRLLRRQRRSPQVNRILHSMKRIVAGLLIAVTITFAVLMTVEAFREKVIEVVVHIYHELTRYDYSSDKDVAVLPEFHFDYLPEGMALVMDERASDHVRNLQFENTSGQYLDLMATATTNDGTDTQIINTEEAQMTTWTIRGAEMTVVSKDGTNIILWVDENNHYTIQSDLSLTELKFIVEGLSTHP